MYGIGLIKGLIETARNFFGSYYDPKRFPTIFYPEQKRQISENSRVFPFLVYDGNDPEIGMRCVACRICEKECPVHCIRIQQGTNIDGKPAKKPHLFQVDIGACMGCQICAEVCPFESIKMNTEYEITAENRFDELVLDKCRLLKSDGYYHSIHPTMAAESDKKIEMLRKKLNAVASAKVVTTIGSKPNPDPLNK